jgi:RNA-binding protein
MAARRPTNMDEAERRRQVHETDATVRVGKGGVEAVTGELRDQLRDRDLVKVKFLRSARGGTDIEELGEALAEESGAELIETRGHTATYR